MNHKWTAAMAAVLLAGSAGGAWGQQMEGGGGFRAGRLDLGIYAGGSLTSEWFNSRTITLDGTPTGAANDDDQGYGPGYAPVFGAFATYWLSPAFGVRVNGNYTPMRLPFASTGFFDVAPDDDGGPTGRSAYVLNTYFYDLDLVLRPFAGRESAGMWRGVYLFAGGGGMTVNLAGENQAACQPALLGQGACLSGEPMQSTVGQGTAGVGMDLLWLGRSLALFGELGAHVYDSPVHVGDDFIGPVTAPVGSTVRIADDRVAVTGRLVAGLKLVLGDLLPPPPVPPPPPPPMAPEPPPAPLAPPPPPAEAPVVTCDIPAGSSAAGADWYVNSQPVVFNGRRYVKYGLPRVLGSGDVVNVGTFQGLPVFAEPSGDRMRPEVLYVSVGTACEFQPYQVETKAGAVRG